MTSGTAGERGGPIVAVVGDVLHTLQAHPGLEDVTFVDAASARATELADAKVLYVWDFRWRELDTLLPRLPSVEWIHAASAGVDHLLSPAVRASGVTLTNSPGVYERSIAEYVLMLMLAYAKGLPATIAAQRERRWAYARTRDVRGQTVLVVGMGRVGSAVAELARAADMRVVGTRRTAVASDVETMPPSQLLEGLHRADHVVVAAALTPETKHLIDAAALAAMKPTAYLVNVARAALVDTEALIDALRGGTIGGAALDVFEGEPLPADSPLWTTPGLLVSPHMSGDADDWDTRAIEVFAEGLRRFRAGQPLANAVDLRRGY